jgi:uncharacterized protein YfcZ (UPF0381/DUF406 family)
MAHKTTHVGYAGETASCVDLAYIAMEEDILAEMERVPKSDRTSLERLLRRLKERRSAIKEFLKVTT